MLIHPAREAQIALLVIEKVQILVLNENIEAFIMHVTSFSFNSMSIYLSQKAQIALLVIKKVQIPMLDKEVKAFVMHVISLSLNLMPIHPAQEAQIALLIIKEVQIPSEYSDFSDVFLEEKTAILPKAISLNQHAIKDQRKW